MITRALVGGWWLLRWSWRGLRFVSPWLLRAADQALWCMCLVLGSVGKSLLADSRRLADEMVDRSALAMVDARLENFVRYGSLAAFWVAVGVGWLLLAHLTVWLWAWLWRVIL